MNLVQNAHRKEKSEIKFVVLNLTFYICDIQLAPEGAVGCFFLFKKGVYQTLSSELKSRKFEIYKKIRQRKRSLRMCYQTLCFA